MRPRPAPAAAGLDGPNLTDFRRAIEAVAQAETDLARLCDDLRAQGYSWTDLGNAAGITKQGMSQWHKRSTSFARRRAAAAGGGRHNPGRQEAR